MRNIARVVLITAGLIWGFGFIGNKYILDSGWTDVQLLFVRFVSAFVFITLFYFKRIIKANRVVIKQGLILGVFLFFGFFFQTWGLEYTTASNNAIITAGYIVILPLIVYLFDRIKVPRNTIMAALITMAGIVIISVDFTEFTIGIGDVLTFLGAVFWAIHIFILGHQTKKHDLFVLLAVQLFVFSVFITTIMILGDGFPTIARGYDDRFNLYGVGLLLGFTASFLAFTMQAFGQKYTNPTEAAILISTESVFGPIFAMLFYSEPFSITLLIGMILVFGGIVLSETGGNLFKQRNKTKQAG
ncbi:DMT family transporter [Candidatus Xianfuyuplasma coldseepsis]|uniref:DMT family transporter n=1 Tax=Candidatus Xianfuyuplasma coldseepsis TaxID=2782163 RepID=A0A7L7KRX9_9MOLU|nr:DMT family transporter [Xianfuyuplasma coldseepsis]QMS85571.1 DMT family transporter [Xianfuyuplasma coldseepsis]